MKFFRGIRDIRTVASEIRQKGLRKAVRNSRDAFRLRMQIARDENFDAAHHVDTSGYVLLTDIEETENNIKNCSEYHGTPVTLAQRLLKMLPGDLSSYAFVDYGSGKGRILFLASRLSFRKVIGVEFMEEFHDVAVRNIQSYRDDQRRCADLQSVCIDAREFEIPQDNCVFYFYRPFVGPVMQAVLEKIKSSWRERPRPMYLIYVCPFSTDPFFDLGFARKMTVRQPLWSRVVPEGYGAVVYQTVDVTDSSAASQNLRK